MGCEKIDVRWILHFIGIGLGIFGLMKHQSLIQTYAKYIRGWKLRHGLGELPMAIRSVRALIYADSLFLKTDQLISFAGGTPEIDVGLFKVEIYRMTAEAVGLDI